MVGLDDERKDPASVKFPGDCDGKTSKTGILHGGDKAVTD